jgi:hypothetical protein
MNATPLAFLAIVVTSSLAACSGRVDVGPPPDGGGSMQDAIADAGATADDASGPGADASLQIDAQMPGLTDAPATLDAEAPLDASAPMDALDAQACVAVPAVDGSCRASCCTPAGDTASFATVVDANAAFQGRWQFCSQQGLKHTFGAPSDAIGMEFQEDDGDGATCKTWGATCRSGNIYYLVQGPSGPVRGAGFDYQLTYLLFGDTVGATTTYQLNITLGGGTWLAHFRYSPCPTEMQIEGMSVDPVLLVPFY